MPANHIDYYAIEDPPEPKPECPPERLLWLTVLREAVFDLLNPYWYASLRREHGTDEPYITGWEFFFGESPGQQAHLRFVCRMAGLDVAAVRDSARRQYERR